MGQTPSIRRAFQAIEANFNYFRAIIVGASLPAHVSTGDRPPKVPVAFRELCTFQSLPTELVLYVFSEMELAPYIISHGVCKEWRLLLPLANLHPIRRRLLNLYHRMVQSPHLLTTRPWILENLRPFDRQAYVNTLLSQYPAIPEEFRMWIMEWPARMAIECLWPGLPHFWFGKRMLSGPLGSNWLSWGSGTSPTLLSAVYKYGTPQVKCIPALLIWFDENPSSTWLIFDKDEPGLFGRVYVSDENDPVRVGEIPAPDTNIDDSSFEPFLRLPLFNDWIAYQEFAWDEAVKRVSPPESLRSSSVDRFCSDVRVLQPIRFKFLVNNGFTIPVFPWTLRHDPVFQARVFAQ